MAEAFPPTKTEALSSIDARYLSEYVEFSGQLREYVNDTLNRTPGDWHRRALADTSRVVRLLERSVRICRAEDNDSGDFAC
jgi:hypothetical protein